MGEGPNQALSERLLVYQDRSEDAEVAEPFATLADPEPRRRLNGGTAAATPPLRAGDRFARSGSAGQRVDRCDPTSATARWS